MMRLLLLLLFSVAAIGFPGAPAAVERAPFIPEEISNLPGLPPHAARPKLGVALSGGGSKASSFAMGVLAGLHDTGVLQEVDVISSVSGGGYAAYFYFSRLLDAALAPPEDSGPGAPIDWFRHCLSNRAREYFAAEGNRIAIAPPAGSGTPSPATHDELMRPRYCPASLVDFEPNLDGADPYRFQNHIGGFQDFLSPLFDYSRVGSREQGAGSKAVTMGLIAATISSLPLHWAANLFFDFRLKASPIQNTYQEGLFRAYGYRPSRFNEARETDRGWQDILAIGDNIGGGARGVDPIRLEETRATQSRLGALEKIYRERALPATFAKPPLWIIGVTASDRAGLDPRQNDPLLHSFELTPFGFGSPCYGLYKAPVNSMSVSDAMASSAAFLHSQQRAKGGALAPLGNAVIDILNAGMGFDYPNPSRSDAYRALTRFVPFPFLRDALGIFPGCGGDGPATIRLSDGGQSENTGLLALIRRRVETIVFADSSQDEFGNMQDICIVADAGARGDPVLSSTAKNATSGARVGWRIDVFGLPELEDICRNSQGTKGYDILDWRNPVLEGAIRIARIDPDSNSLIGIPPRGTPCEAVETDCLRLLLLKPGVDLRYFDVIRRAYWNNLIDGTESPSQCLRMREHIAMRDEPRVKEREKREAFLLADAIRSCKDQLDLAVQRIPDAPTYPPSVIRFVIDNWAHIYRDTRFSHAERRRAHEPHPDDRAPTEQFPQNSTFQLTLNSSPALYEAYRDLGRFAARIAAQHACVGCQLPPVSPVRACDIKNGALQCPPALPR